MALYLLDAGPDRFATLAAVRRAYGLSIGEAGSLVASLPSRLPDADPATEESIATALAALGAGVSRDEPVARPVVAPPTPAPPAAPVFAPPTEPVSSPVAEPEPVEVPVCVMLTDAGRSKLAAVKVVKEATETRLAVAKEMVDSAPISITLKSRARAEWMTMRLAEVGATAFIEDDEPMSDDETADGVTAVCLITVTDARRSGMQLVRLLKERLGMRYADAARIAEHGGRLPVTYDYTYKSQLDADRPVKDLTALGVAFTTD